MVEGTQFSSIVDIKPAVENFTEKNANFVDGTNVNIDTVIYCTGEL